MISLYEEYVTMNKSLSMEQMQLLHKEMAEEIGNDNDGIELYEELLKTSIRYNSFRGSWLLWSKEEKQEKDSGRTSCHDALIVKFNQLAKYLKMQGKSVTWRDVLGYEENDRWNRKRIGDFACYLVFVQAIHAR